MLTILLIFSLTTLYIFVKRHYSQWQRMGLATDEPVIPFGSLLKVIRKERPLGLVITDIYERFQDKAVGIYIFFTPAILLRDAEQVRKIMTTDFQSFHDRGFYVDEKNEPLSANIFNLRGQAWRSLRVKLTASFTPGKLKGMFDTIDDVADKLMKHMSEKLKDGTTHRMEMKELSTTYAVDIIGSVVFGLDIDSFSNPDNEFRVLSDRLFKDPKSHAIHRIRNLMNFICAPAARFLSWLGIRDPVTQNLREIVERTIKYREESGVVRKDLLQLLIQLRNTGNISEDNDQLWGVDSSAENLQAMSIDMITANLSLFYVAGSETTSATIAFTIYELAMYPAILQRAQQEVDQCLKKHDLKPAGRLTYEAIQDMKYLDLCVMETTRKYPALPFLNRECTQDYSLPGTDFTIKKGTSIIIPMMGIHRDPQYFPNPMDYKPERFAAESLDHNPVAFMPFGEGPRRCIAQRNGVVNVKVALAKILANFNIASMARQEIEFKFHTTADLVAKDGLWVEFSKRWD